MAGRRLTSADYRLAILVLVIYAAGRAPFLGQWDSFDYLKQTVTHRLSDLAFGRPAFIGYNIALWEGAKALFHLRPTQVETVMMAAVVTLGVVGVLLFARLSRQMLPAKAARMATIGFALAPLYAVYAGYIMTEVPMLVATLACATVLWCERPDGRIARDLAAGALFGLAVGIREQAVTLAPAYAWIIWVRRHGIPDRASSLAWFGASAAVVSIGPVLALYLYDPAAFSERIGTWLAGIPMGHVHFARNVQASLLFTAGMAPAAWLGLLAAVWSGYRHRAATFPPGFLLPLSFRASVAGVLLCLVLPLVVLWRDADVQLHPRYSLIVLPAAVVVCASAWYRWVTHRRAVLIWGFLQIAVFGLAQIAIAPFRNMQSQKMQFARSVYEAVPGSALIAGGSYSPIFDYYRAVNDRPEWEILWSGWGWRRETAAAIVGSAWTQNKPVYICDGPFAWFYFENQRLDLFDICSGHRSEIIAPGLTRISRTAADHRERGTLAASPQ